jgi:hypothetical protein
MKLRIKKKVIDTYDWYTLERRFLGFLWLGVSVYGYSVDSLSMEQLIKNLKKALKLRVNKKKYAYYTSFEEIIEKGSTVEFK